MRPLSRSILLFFGTFSGALLSAPIFNAVQLYFNTQIASTGTKDTTSSSVLIAGYYNTIIILLLTLIPVILAFTYFYIKGASEERAQDAAENAARDQIQILRHELTANQSQIAWSMSDYIYPVVKLQTEQYLQERDGHERRTPFERSNPSRVAASTISGWLKTLEDNDILDEQRRRELEQALDENPPELRGE